MKKILLLFVLVLASLYASAAISSAEADGGKTLILTKSETGDVITYFPSGPDFTKYTTVKIQNATGSSAGVTAAEVNLIQTHCTNATKIDVSSMALSGDFTTITPGNLKVVISQPSTDKYNAICFNPNGSLYSNLSGYDFTKEFHVKIIGTVTSNDFSIGNFTSLYIDAYSATTATATDINSICIQNGSSSLKSLIAPSAMTSVPANFCLGCQKLMKVKLPDGVTSIGASAFENCFALTAINIPSKVLTIGNRAFYASAIQSIHLPEGLTSIGVSAFRECHFLPRITLPASLTSIGEDIFSNCYILTDVYCNGPVPKVVDDNGTETAALLAENDQLYGQSHCPGDGVVETSTPSITRKDYWATTLSLTQKNGLIVLHVPNTYLYDEGETVGYTEKYRYVNDGTSGTNAVHYYKFAGADYTTRYPSRLQLMDVASSKGWKAFALVDVSYDPTANRKELTNIKDATWYTLCFPFKMTRSMIEETFGAGTEVCEFVGVTSNGATGTDEIRTIHFTKDLIEEGLDANNLPKTLASAEIVQANHPYMIHPSMAPTDKNASDVTCYYISNTYTGYPVSFDVTGKTPESYIGTGKTASSSGYVDGYTFKGNYTTDTFMPANVFYLSTSDGKDVYKYTTKTSTTSHFKQFTAVIFYSGQLAASKMSLIFDEDEANSVTGISDLQLAPLSAKVSDKVFNIQGQLVRTGSTSLEGLDKGIYIVNGKKYVVR